MRVCENNIMLSKSVGVLIKAMSRPDMESLWEDLAILIAPRGLVKVDGSAFHPPIWNGIWRKVGQRLILKVAQDLQVKQPCFETLVVIHDNN